MKKFMILLILLSSLGLSSCIIEGEGPVGPPGYDGRDASEFIRTMKITVYPDSWAPVQDEYGMWTVNIHAPYITTDIVDYGAVMTYIGSANGKDSWGALPYTANFYTENNEQYAHEFDVWHGPGTLELIYKDTHPTMPAPPIDVVTYKAVILSDVPYGLYVAGNSYSLEYEQLQEIYDIDNPKYAIEATK